MELEETWSGEKFEALIEPIIPNDFKAKYKSLVV